jgi:hypothetical protein
LRSRLVGLLDVDKDGAGDDTCVESAASGIDARLPKAVYPLQVLDGFDVKPLIFTNYIAKRRQYFQEVLLHNFRRSGKKSLVGFRTVR